MFTPRGVLAWLRDQREISLALFVVLIIAVTGIRPTAPFYDFKTHQQVLDAVNHFFIQLELQHFNSRQRVIVENREHSGIHLVTLGNPTTGNPGMRKLYGKHPYSREIYAKLIRFLNRGKPKLLVIDAAFELGNDLDYPERDIAFANAVKDSKFRVITALITQAQHNADPQTQAFIKTHRIKLLGDPQKLSMNWALSFNMPFQQLIHSGAEFYPATNLSYDASRMVRRAMPFIYFVDMELYRKTGDIVQSASFFPSLVLSPLLDESRTATITETGDIKIGNHTIDTDGGAYQIIKWYGDARGIEMREYKNPTIYPKTEMWDIIYTELKLECAETPQLKICSQLDDTVKGRMIPPEVFNGKYVVMGFAIENEDVHQTIYGTNYPGVYTQTNILDNYLHNDFIHEAPWQWTLLLSLLMVGLAGYFCYYRNVVFSLVLVGSIGLGYTLATYVCYQNMNLWLNWIYPITSMVVTVLLAFIIRYVRAESKKQQLRMAFAKYVSPAAMQAIEKDPTNLELGGHRRELTFMFCDIRGFTAFSETHEADFVQRVLTQYFRVMNTIILHTYNGSINKLMGDAIMAYWGFPITREDHPVQAVLAAFTMKRAIEVWQSDTKKPPIRIGIGINTGNAMIGNVGSEDFMDFTVIGDAVNIASRLEGLNKEYGTTIIVSGDTYHKIKGHIACKELGTIKVRGKAQETKIYEPIEILSPELAIQVDSVMPKLIALMEEITLNETEMGSYGELTEEDILED